jgi:hypothetical protein
MINHDGAHFLFARPKRKWAKRKTTPKSQRTNQSPPHKPESFGAWREGHTRIDVAIAPKLKRFD